LSCPSKMRYLNKFVLLTAFVATSLIALVDGHSSDLIEVIISTATGAQFVPAVMTSTTAQLSMNFNRTLFSAIYSVNVHNGTQIKRASLNCGKPGVNGVEIASLQTLTSSTLYDGSLHLQRSCNNVTMKSIVNLYDAIRAGMVYWTLYLSGPRDTEVGVARGQVLSMLTNRSLNDVRFNKFPPLPGHRDFAKGTHSGLFPLLPKDYPVSGTTARILSRETIADSVVVEGDYSLLGESAADYLKFLDAPLYPSSNPNNPNYTFWKELEHVVDVQIDRRKNTTASKYNRWADLWSTLTMSEIARAVQNEYPGSQQQALLFQWFRAGGRMDRSIVPLRSEVDMVGRQSLISKVNTYVFAAVGPPTFLLKWDKGVPRPEEMAWLIASGQYTEAHGVPASLVQKINSMNLTNMTSFTAFLDGSPRHPSWPAMHAAGSQCSTWLSVIANLTAAQYCEFLRMDYSVAYARTVAGVHYPMDNYAGLNLGMEVVRRKLPALLKRDYGWDETAFVEKFDRLRFNWKDFDPQNCTIAGRPVGDRL
jgi:hypothetical protein